MAGRMQRGFCHGLLVLTLLPSWLAQARKRDQGYASLASDSSYERSLRALADAEYFRQSTNEDRCLFRSGKVSGR